MLVRIPPEDHEIQRDLAMITMMIRSRLPDAYAGHLHLMPVGKALADRGHHALAADLYESLAQAIECSPAATTRIGYHARASIYLRAGRSYGALGRLDDAADAIEEAATLAPKSRDQELSASAELWKCGLLRLRGDLPGAETVLTLLIDMGVVKRSEVLFSQALRERGAVRTQRGNYGGGLDDFRAALKVTHDRLSREAVFGDIATAAMHLGYYDAAYATLTRLVERAEGANIRGSAYINLLTLAVLRRDAAAFREWRAKCRWADLPPMHRIVASVEEGKGVLWLDGSDAARPLLVAAIAAAREVGLNEPLHYAEMALDELDAQVALPLGGEAKSTPPELAEVLNQLDALEPSGSQ